MYTIICEGCNKPFKHRQPHTKACSLECKKKRHFKIYGRYSNLGLPPNTVGSVSEMFVACRYMLLGYDVFRSLSLVSGCDLIAVKGEKVLRIEVKTGYINPTTKALNCPNPEKQKGKYDVLAVYVLATNKVYVRKTAFNYKEL